MSSSDCFTYNRVVTIDDESKEISFGLTYHPAEPATHEDRASEAYIEIVSAHDSEGLDVLDQLPDEILSQIEQEGLSCGDF